MGLFLQFQLVEAGTLTVVDLIDVIGEPDVVGTELIEHLGIPGDNEVVQSHEGADTDDEDLVSLGHDNSPYVVVIIRYVKHAKKEIPCGTSSFDYFIASSMLS